MNLLNGGLRCFSLIYVYCYQLDSLIGSLWFTAKRLHLCLDGIPIGVRNTQRPRLFCGPMQRRVVLIGHEQTDIFQYARELFLSGCHRSAATTPLFAWTFILIALALIVNVWLYIGVLREGRSLCARLWTAVRRWSEYNGFNCKTTWAVYIMLYDLAFISMESVLHSHSASFGHTFAVNVICLEAFPLVLCFRD